MAQDERNRSFSTVATDIACGRFSPPAARRKPWRGINRFRKQPSCRMLARCLILATGGLDASGSGFHPTTSGITLPRRDVVRAGRPSTTCQTGRSPTIGPDRCYARPGRVGKLGPATRHRNDATQIRSHGPPAGADRRRRLSPRPSACPGPEGRGCRPRGPHHGIEERFAENAGRHFGRKIGYWRRSQFCTGLAVCAVRYEPVSLLLAKNRVIFEKNSERIAENTK